MYILHLETGHDYVVVADALANFKHQEETRGLEQGGSPGLWRVKRSETAEKLRLAIKKA